MLVTVFVEKQFDVYIRRTGSGFEAFDRRIPELFAHGATEAEALEAFQRRAVKGDYRPRHRHVPMDPN